MLKNNPIGIEIQVSGMLRSGQSIRAREDKLLISNEDFEKMKTLDWLKSAEMLAPIDVVDISSFSMGKKGSA